MNKKLIIFGTADAAELAHYYFSKDSNYEVVAFTVDMKYIDKQELFGLPIVPFESVSQRYPPENYDFFVALGYSTLNEARKEKYLAAKLLGYRFASYISSRATLLNEGNIGENCFILENNTIQPFVSIGNNVTLWSGNHIGHHTKIEDHCFLASHIVVSGRVHIQNSCFIGVNATLRDHIVIGEKNIIGAGTLILKSTEPYELYIGSATKHAGIPSQRLKKI